MYTLERLIGNGIRYPYSVDQYGRVSQSNQVDRINHSLFLIFSTPKGSRLMLPDFGSNLYTYRFEPNDSVLHEQIRFSLLEDISKWEPRIRVRDIKFYTDSTLVDNNVLYISVSYTLINSDVEGNFVYPFRVETYDTAETSEDWRYQE